MKKFTIYLFALMSIMACGDDENEYPNGSEGDSAMNKAEVLASMKFVQDDVIGFVPEGGIEIFPKTRFKQEIQGFGWENVGSYKINADGTVEEKDYFLYIEGGGRSHYFFDKKLMRQFLCTTSWPELLFYKESAYEYDEQNQNCIFQGFHILSYNDETREMTVLNHGKSCRVEFYQRMSKDRLKEIRRQYSTNIDDKH